MFAVFLTFFARPLVKKLLPFVLGAVALAIIVAFVANKWDNFKDTIYENGRVSGVKEMQAKLDKQIEENNRMNRETDKKIRDGIGKYTITYEKERAERITREKNSQAIIEKRIVENPEFYTNPACTIPADVLFERNRIRALGPK